MKNKKTPRAIYISLLFLLGAVIIGIVSVKAIDSQSTGYSVSNGASNEPVEFHYGTESENRCGYVDNSTGVKIFVGTKNILEWESFRDNSPSGADGCDEGYNAHTNKSYDDYRVCGSWDLDCDGKVTKKYKHVCDDYSCNIFDRSCDEGWNGSVADCGDEEDWFTGDCVSGDCEEIHKTQKCH